MKKSSFLILIAFIFVIGCNSGGGTSSEPATEQPAEQAAPPPAQAQDPAGFQNPPHGEPGHVHNESAPDTGMAVPQGDVKLNPPHGEPGHRCDIAVGAPLP